MAQSFDYVNSLSRKIDFGLLSSEGRVKNACGKDNRKDLVEKLGMEASDGGSLVEGTHPEKDQQASLAQKGNGEGMCRIN